MLVMTISSFPILKAAILSSDFIDGWVNIAATMTWTTEMSFKVIRLINFTVISAATDAFLFIYTEL